MLIQIRFNNTLLHFVRLMNILLLADQYLVIRNPILYTMYSVHCTLFNCKLYTVTRFWIFFYTLIMSKFLYTNALRITRLYLPHKYDSRCENINKNQKFIFLYAILTKVSISTDVITNIIIIQHQKNDSFLADSSYYIVTNGIRS